MNIAIDMDKENIALLVFLIVSSIIFVLFGPNIKEYFSTIKNESNSDNSNNNNYDYDIQIIDDFLTHDECDYIIHKGKPNLQRSEVLGKDSTEVSKVRTSTNCFINQHDNDNILEKIGKRISKLNGLPMENQEEMQVVHYEPGEFYEPHFDAFIEKTPFNLQEKQRGGQRHNTVYIYLNDVQGEGGETEFPKLEKKVKPKKGRAVFWKNLEDDNETPHPLSLHAGLSPKNGEKWGMNVWTRCDTFSK